MLSRLSLILLTSLALASCYAPLSSKQVKPTIPPSDGISQQDLKAAADPSPADPLAATASTLASLRIAHDRLATGDSTALPEYNYLVARFAEQIRRTGIKPWQNRVELPTGQTRFVLRGTQPDDLKVQERYFIASDTLKFSGRYAVAKPQTSGAGAPLLAILRSPPTAHESFDKNFRYRNVTAIVTFDGDSATVDLKDPYVTDTVSIGGRRYPLHADFGANISYALSQTRIDKLGLARLLNPERYNNTARLSRLQPYDPARIPVLFVHGLQDTPASFLPMYLSLMEDPEIRQKYQFWVFSYPSGYPYPYSASLLRAELDRMQKAYPSHKDIVIIGHSMGGLITRLMLTDADEKLWTNLFGYPPNETTLKGDSRAMLEDALVFDSRDDIDRAVFISAPHRGSNLASNWIGRLGSKLVRLPAFMADTRDSIVNVAKADTAAIALNRAPNSIDTLAPDNAFIVEINQYPLDPKIPYHSIMGDRGKGNTPDSSDGVVAYWSSHLDGAKSEKIVPSNHSAHQNEEGIQEVQRILLQHAGAR